MKKIILLILSSCLLTLSVRAQQLPPRDGRTINQVMVDKATWTKDFMAIPRGTVPSFPAYVPDSLKDGALFNVLPGVMTPGLYRYKLATTTWELAGGGDAVAKADSNIRNGYITLDYFNAHSGSSYTFGNGVQTFAGTTGQGGPFGVISLQGSTLATYTLQINNTAFNAYSDIHMVLDSVLMSSAYTNHENYQVKTSIITGATIGYTSNNTPHTVRELKIDTNQTVFTDTRHYNMARYRGKYHVTDSLSIPDVRTVDSLIAAHGIDTTFLSGHYLKLSGGTLSGNLQAHKRVSIGADLDINKTIGYPGHVLEVTNDFANDGNLYLAQFTAYSNDGGNSNLHYRKARGTASAPSAVLSSDFLFSAGFQGYGATGFQPSSAAIQAVVTENFDDTHNGTMLQLAVTPNGNYNGNRIIALKLNQDGTANFINTITAKINSGTAGTDSLTVTANGLIKKISPTYYSTGDTTKYQTILNLFPRTDTRYYTKTAADAKYPILSSANTFTAKQTVSFSGMGTTPIDALILQTTDAATSGNQKVSPQIALIANGFGTTAGTSQPVRFNIFNLPAQGGSPTGTLTIQSIINGGTPLTVFQLSSGGTITLNTLNVGTFSNSGNNFLNTIRQNGFSNIKIYASDTYGNSLPAVDIGSGATPTASSGITTLAQFDINASGLTGTAGFNGIYMPIFESGTFTGNKYAINIVNSTSANGGGTIKNLFQVDHLGNTFGTSFRPLATTVSAAPTLTEGMIVAITDSSTSTPGSTITGGGSNHVLGYYNGTNLTVL